VATASILLLAGTFALAAVAKLRDRAPFRATVGLVVRRSRATTAIAWLVPAAELALAAWLLSGAAPRAAGLAALVLLAAFSVALAAVGRATRAAAADAVLPCNCFGTGAGGDVADGRRRNLALALAAAVLVAWPPDGRPDVEQALGAATVAIGAVCAWQLALALVAARRAPLTGRALR
jgi:hypothetical protein